MNPKSVKKNAKVAKMNPIITASGLEFKGNKVNEPLFRSFAKKIKRVVTI